MSGLHREHQINPAGLVPPTADHVIAQSPLAMFITHPLLLLAAGLGLASAQSPDAFARESPPSGCAVVRKLGPQAGEHPSVGAAIEALDKTATAPACIFIHPGVYAEQLFIDYKGPLVIYGYTPE